MTAQRAVGGTGGRGGAENMRHGGAAGAAPDPAQRGAAPISSEAKRRVRLAENQRKGFESAWNEYFDCYASTTYVEEPLIRLEDVSYHLYLKKHINPNNPRWELPSFRQLKKILGLSQDKLQGIEARLGTARLLVKESGKGKGERGENVANDYLLYEPLELADFLVAVANGELPGALNEKGQRRLAEIRARVCGVGGGQWTVDGGQQTAIAATAAPVPSTAHRQLSTAQAGVSESGTGAAPESGTPAAPTSGTPGVAVFGTPPAPDSGTQNTRRLTPPSQQTTQQQAARGANERGVAATQPGGDVVVVGAGVALRDDEGRGAAVAPPATVTSDPLVARGISPLVARRLRQGCPAERIARQVAIFDFLRDEQPADPKLTPGRLRRQIEEDWATPAAFAVAQAAPAPANAATPRDAAAGDDSLRHLATAAAARQGRLAALGLCEADQGLWARVVQATPVLPPLFRSALLHAPQGDGPAVVVFPSIEESARAQSPAHAATRARVAARLAAALAPAGARGVAPAVAVRYLAYEEAEALVAG